MLPVRQGKCLFKEKSLTGLIFSVGSHHGCQAPRQEEHIERAQRKETGSQLVASKQGGERGARDLGDMCSATFLF